jgi:biopolymer transport protein ExbB
LGTVLGIIKAFHSMGAAQGAGLAVISAGIAEALVTTALGLVVAIPAAWMFNSLTGRLERLHVDMQNAASEVVVFASQRASTGRTAA